MGPKLPGMDRFRSSSTEKVDEELLSIRNEVTSIGKKIDETLTRLTKLEQDFIRLVSKVEKTDDGMTTEAKVLFDSINEIGKQNTTEIDVLKRMMDVAQRRLVVLEASMKELGK